MYSCFLSLVQSRVFLHFAWIFGAGERIYFYVRWGKGHIRTGLRSSHAPPSPFIGGGTPTPYPASPRAGFLPIKNRPLGPSLMPSSSPAGFPASCLLPACFPALLHPKTLSISLNTYLVKRVFTLHRLFSVSLGCSATFFYPHRSSSQL